MAQNFLGCDREQEYLMPLTRSPSVGEWLMEGHLAWFVLDALERVDLAGIYGDYDYRLDGSGRAAHDPGMRGFSVWLGASAASARAGSWFVVRCSSPEWLVGRDRPDEPCELAGGRDDDLLVRLAACGHPAPAAMQALLGAPRALEDDRVLAALARSERSADAGAPR